MTIPSLLNHPKPARRLVTRGSSTLKASTVTPKREVTDRVLLASGFIVSVKVPTKRNAMTVPTTGEAYEQFGSPVKGGYLNFHLYDGKNCQRRGERIWVSAEVYEKTMEDGKKFIYVDLRPTDAPHLTYEMKVYQDESLMPEVMPEDATVFACPGEVKGVIAFLPRPPYTPPTDTV